MDYKKKVAETWRHWDLAGAARDYTNLVRYATLAASSHNTQPWRFQLERGRISILPDLTRRCPAVDPDDHHLYASLGCAAENLLVVAQAGGLQGHCLYDALTSCVRVEFEQRTPSRSALFEAIPKRQCTRSLYDGTQLSREQLRLLESVSQDSGVSVQLLTSDDHKEKVGEYVARGNAAQIGDARWVDELRTWIRFNAREAVRTGDGLYGRAMGNPDVPRWLGEAVIRLTLSARRQTQKDVKQIRSSAAIAVFFSEADDKAHWIQAGRCYQRFALQAAALDLRTAFINQPVEVANLRAQFAAWLGIGSRRPDLVVRIGRGPEMRRSLRRPLKEVLI